MDEMDLQAWATGYYVGLAFNGQFPEKPNLLKATPAKDEAEVMAKRFEAWIAVNNQRFKEAKKDG